MIDNAILFIIIALATLVCVIAADARGYERHCTRDVAGQVRCICSVGVRYRWEC